MKFTCALCPFLGCTSGSRPDTAEPRIPTESWGPQLSIPPGLTSLRPKLRSLEAAEVTSVGLRSRFFQSFDFDMPSFGHFCIYLRFFNAERCAHPLTVGQFWNFEDIVKIGRAMSKTASQVWVIFDRFLQISYPLAHCSSGWWNFFKISKLTPPPNIYLSFGTNFFEFGWPEVGQNGFSVLVVQPKSGFFTKKLVRKSKMSIKKSLENAFQHVGSLPANGPQLFSPQEPRPDCLGACYGLIF